MRLTADDEIACKTGHGRSCRGISGTFQKIASSGKLSIMGAMFNLLLSSSRPALMQESTTARREILPAGPFLFFASDYFLSIFRTSSN